MIDLKRIEKVLIELTDERSKHQISQLFDSYRENNIIAFGQGMNTFNHFFMGDDTDKASVAMICFIAGVFMAGMSEKEEFHKVLFDDVVERCAKERGEHIKDMAAFRASKK